MKIATWHGWFTVGYVPVLYFIVCRENITMKFIKKKYKERTNFEELFLSLTQFTFDIQTLYPFNVIM